MSGTEVLAHVAGKSVCISADIPSDVCQQLHVAFRQMNMRVVETYVADVFVVTRPGGTNKGIAATTFLRGCFQMTPGLVLSHGQQAVP